MARKVIEKLDCDGCLKKEGREVDAVMKLIIGPDEYHLCESHGEKFRSLIAEALGNTTDTAQSA
ncbi:hypothetical protein OG401_14430 [Kitasatospora purpeofusca]|uniref:hypothetical protein n=1 Tax=Kitasatospora purpeofusca TaxID=67352 RepID=UPI002252C44E|nr:hypothetical protein [Kitasatospora purpeofusca]MCX4685496.1 hypothetical protein [Kitasatospora purpeofusca]